MSKGPWIRDIAERIAKGYLAREPGVGKGGNHSHQNNWPEEIYDQETGLTHHQREVFEQYLLVGYTKAAKELDMSLAAVKDAVNKVRDKLDLEGNRTEVYLDYTDKFGDIGSGYSAPDQTSENYTDPTIEGGENPWDYDSEGNYVGS